MAIWEENKICPNCHREVNILCDKCPYCGTDISSVATDYDSSITTISGTTFTIPSVTDVMPSFTKIAKIYDKNIDAEIPENSFWDTTCPIEEIVEVRKDLEYYINIGYLKRLQNGNLKLTELGKQAYWKNKELRDKIAKNSGKIKI